MKWILATRGASIKLRATPFTETVIPGVYSVVYRPGIEPVAFSGRDTNEGQAGTFARGLHRVSGFLFSYYGSMAEAFFAIEDEIDLIVRYRANAEIRTRTFKDVIFIGDAIVTFPALNSGASELVGVPFRVQIPDTESLDDHIVDALDT